jgi:type IV secretory pathway protease TraF
VNASDIRNVSYQAIAGSEELAIRANDGTAPDPHWGAWSVITVTTPTTSFSPASATISSTRGQIYATTASNPLGLYTETDPSGATVVQYQFYVNDSAGGLGTLLLNGVAQANDAAQTVNASALSTISYQAIAGSELLAIRANDGTVAHPVWGAWSVITATAPAATLGANFTTANATVSAASGQVYASTTAASPLGLFSAVADTTGGTIAQYDFFDSASAGSIGSFLVNNVAQANGTHVTVSASALSTVTYSISSGTQAISIRANDGTVAHPVWGAWSTVTVSVGAVFTATNTTISPTRDQTYTTTTASNPLGLYSVSDETGNAITQYEFDVNDTAGGLGNLFVSGVAQANDAVLVVNASVLNTVSYQAIAGSEALAIRANDGTVSNPRWGAWSVITVTAPAVTSGASFTDANATVSAASGHVYSTTTASSPLGLFSAAADTTGGSIAQYEFFDSASAGSVGGFLVSGATETNGAVLAVSASALSTVTYSISSGSQAISIRANDGTLAHPVWGAWTTVTVTVGAVATATNATITPTRDQTYTTTTPSNPLGLYSVSDETGNAITQYEFDVNDTAGGLGNLFVSGVAQANDAVLVVNASALNTVSYQAIAGSEVLAIRANDGTASNPHWGAWSLITVNAPAVTATGASFAAINATVTLGSSHTYSTTSAASPLGLYNAVTDPSGGVIAQYDFFDNASAGSVGSFLVNNVAQANGTHVTVSASALNTATYSISSGTQAISIRANDGTVAHPIWGAWTTVTLTAPAVTGAPVSSALAVIPDLLSNSSPVLSAAATSIVSPAALLQHDTQLTPLFVIHSA